MVVTARPSARKAGIRQLWNGMPSSQTVQAPQSPCVAALLDAEPAVLAQERAEALAGRRLRRKRLAVDREVHARSGELRPDLLGVVIGEVALVGRRAVHVVEPVRILDGRVDRAAQRTGRRHAVEAELHRLRRRRGDR